MNKRIIGFWRRPLDSWETPPLPKGPNIVAGPGVVELREDQWKKVSNAFTSTGFLKRPNTEYCYLMEDDYFDGKGTNQFKTPKKTLSGLHYEGLVKFRGVMLKKTKRWKEVLREDE